MNLKIELKTYYLKSLSKVHCTSGKINLKIDLATGVM